MTSIGLGMLSLVSAVFSTMTLVSDNRFWTTPHGWLLALAAGAGVWRGGAG